MPKRNMHIKFAENSKQEDGGTSSSKAKFQLGGRTPIEKQKSLYPSKRIEHSLDPRAQAEAIEAQAEFEAHKNRLQMAVLQRIQEAGYVHSSQIFTFIARFFDDVGIDPSYFRVMNDELIAAHIHSIYAYKALKNAQQSDKHIDDLFLKQDYGDDLFLYSTRSNAAADKLTCIPVEREIEMKFLLEGYINDPMYEEMKPSFKDQPWRIEVFTTQNAVEEGGDFNFPLRFYILRKPKFAQVGDMKSAEEDRIPVGDYNARLSSDDLTECADENWLDVVSDRTKDMYWDVVNEVRETLYPVVRVVDRGDVAYEKKVIIGYRHGSTHSLFSSLTELYHSVGLTAVKKFVEQFADGVSIICMWFRPLSFTQTGDLDEGEFEDCLQAFFHDLGTLFAKPRHSISIMFSEGDDEQNILTVREAAFIACAWQFAHQFLNQYGEEYQALLSSIRKHDPSALGHLYKMKQNLRQDTFSEARVLSAWKGHAMFAKILYQEFRGRHHPRLAHKMDGLPDLSHLDEMARKNASSQIDYDIFAACVNFLKHILKTNFFKREKLALSFRLDPRFLDANEFPLAPFGVFYVCGSFFRGFHVRFSDIARGGIRIIRSRSRAAFARNTGSVFNENYNLASTQFRKNKDIPEGGSKGTVIIDYGCSFEMGIYNFEKYIDSILDLLIPNEGVLDHFGQEEILFMGPDEGTAELMDWACLRAKKRGYKFWKAFTTGKSPSLGGIPHDVDGMTTRGVHQYVMGVIGKLGLNEEELTKCQTGGPDGDLGSNEIKISGDKTTVIIDGSGTLYDPNGIDRDEMMRLAQARQMVDHFNIEKLSCPEAFRVLCNENDVTLPHGEVVESGLRFRNGFHTHPLFRSDFFVPCGGRPEAINLNNVAKLFDDRGNCAFRFIIEGANLFFSNEARSYLEERGIIMFKDASANKGGVTSSSCEVLCALALTDDQHDEHMCIKGDEPPQFYRTYVQQVIEIIERNANAEFNCIWDENERGGKRRTVLTDILSNKINDLNVELVNSRLWDREDLRKFVILDAIPDVLVDLVGEEQIFERVPQAYLKAIFGAHFAAMFVYEKGLNTSPFSFTDFLEVLNDRIEGRRAVVGNGADV